MPKKRQMDGAKKTHPFGELINCPICFDVYEGRILMCSAGHAVCEKCQRNLADCPICRCKYTGTRNYQLEQMVSKLKEMNQDIKKTSTNESGDTSVSSNSNKPNTMAGEIEANNTTENRVRLGSNFSSSSSIPVELSSASSSSLLEIPMALNCPLQIAGSNIRCQMVNCQAALPICRLYNHIRYHHESFYKEVKVDGDTTPVMEFSIPPRNYRHAIKISSFGLFFLVINVNKEQGGTTFKGWLQGTVPNKKARHYKYNLELTLNNLVAKYSDLCYGYNQTSRRVEALEACLNISTSLNIRSIGVKLTISKNFGSVVAARETNTEYEYITPPPVTQNNNNRQRGNNRQSGRGHGRKNKR